MSPDRISSTDAVVSTSRAAGIRLPARSHNWRQRRSHQRWMRSEPSVTHQNATEPNTTTEQTISTTRSVTSASRRVRSMPRTSEWQRPRHECGGGAGGDHRDGERGGRDRRITAHRPAQRGGDRSAHRDALADRGAHLVHRRGGPERRTAQQRPEQVDAHDPFDDSDHARGCRRSTMATGEVRRWQRRTSSAGSRPRRSPRQPNTTSANVRRCSGRPNTERDIRRYRSASRGK